MSSREGCRVRWNVEIFFDGNREPLVMKTVKWVGDTSVFMGPIEVRVLDVDGRLFSFKTFFFHKDTITLEGAIELNKDGQPVGSY
jgi:hypothetical protein